MLDATDKQGFSGWNLKNPSKPYKALNPIRAQSRALSSPLLRCFSHPRVASNQNCVRAAA